VGSIRNIKAGDIGSYNQCVSPFPSLISRLHTSAQASGELSAFTSRMPSEHTLFRLFGIF
jgi:hypothetical protein